MYNIFVGLGGTGTQIATAISNLYPFLWDAGITNDKFDIYILDKDITSGIYTACADAYTSYITCRDLLPYEKKLDPYIFKSNAYQNLQIEFKDKDTYNVLDIIGKDDEIKDLASMCWKKGKQTESLKEGNNRDPSRGSLDVAIVLPTMNLPL
ncbi:hypothetical protein FACS1894190_16950 [Spirochaetia bacterium]|nr:hypothetical protein FACS1894190_16950 [Spirochaetia bacterium]